MSDHSFEDKEKGDQEKLSTLSSLCKLAEENQQLREDYNKLRKHTIRLGLCGCGFSKKNLF